MACSPAYHVHRTPCETQAPLSLYAFNPAEYCTLHALVSLSWREGEGGGGRGREGEGGWSTAYTRLEMEG